MVELNVVKSANRGYVFVGLSNIINYSVIIKNIGDETALNVKLREVISEEVYFVEGTFKVNGCKLNIKNISNYINIGSINSGANAVITYSVEVSKYFKLDEVVNKVIVSYCDKEGNNKSIESKSVIIPVIKVNACAQKNVDKCIVSVCDEMSYTVTIRNIGNINIDNVRFIDKLSPYVELLPASISINVDSEILENITCGAKLGTIKPNSSVIIEFRLKVISMPDMGYIDNAGKFSFSYTVMDNGTPITSIGESFTNRVRTKVIERVLKC